VRLHDVPSHAELFVSRPISDQIGCYAAEKSLPAHGNLVQINSDVFGKTASGLMRIKISTKED
jgi:hypothetical protein